MNGTVGDASPPIVYDEVSTTSTPQIEINHRFIVPATPQNIKKATEFAKTLQETGGNKSLQIVSTLSTHPLSHFSEPLKQTFSRY